MFDIYVHFKSAKDVWEALQKKYGGDDVRMQKFVTSRWLEFTIIDDKPVLEQVHEYEAMVSYIQAEGMKICEKLTANVLVNKIPKSRNDYKFKLKHEKKQMNLDELGGRHYDRRCQPTNSQVYNYSFSSL